MAADNNDFSKLLIVKTDVKGLQYDINGILKAFYPAYDVRVLEPGERVHDEIILSLPVYMDVCVEESDECGRITINYSLEEDKDDIDFPYTQTFKAADGMDSKTAFKLFFYDFMSEISGRKLPWGNLTGIRPTKIAMTKMNEGMNDAEVEAFLKGYHRVSDEKTALAIDIAHRESALMDKLDCRDGYSLYIGIPFCPTTCLYCSFTSFPISAWRKRIDDYLDALGRELDYVAKEIGGSPQTVYIGGGTPTSLDEEHLDRLLDMITKTIDMSATIEFTCEAGRPDSITADKLRTIKKYGVTRISVNPQTMQQRTLDLIGRRTTVQQITDSFCAAREAGIDNINMDIILGLPGENEEDVSDTLDKIKALGPDSLTVHSLAIKRASKLRRKLDEIGIDSLKNTDETMKLSAKAAYDMGMKPYYLYRQKNMSGNFENTGFSIPEKEGIYNILIMEEVQTIVACGAGTVTKRVYPDGRIERCDTVKDVGMYIDKIEEMIDRKRQLFT